MRSTPGALSILAACYCVAFTPSVLSYTPSSHQWGMQTRRSLLVMKQEGGGKEGMFSLANLFGGDGANLEPHPSVRTHISPLNRLGPDKTKKPKSEPLPGHPDVRSGTLPNGLPYIILPNASPPGRFEAHLQVFSGSGKCNYLNRGKRRGPSFPSSIAGWRLTITWVPRLLHFVPFV